MGLVCN